MSSSVMFTCKAELRLSCRHICVSTGGGGGLFYFFFLALIAACVAQSLFLPFGEGIRRASSHLEPQKGTQHPKVCPASGMLHGELPVSNPDPTPPDGPRHGDNYFRELFGTTAMSLCSVGYPSYNPAKHLGGRRTQTQ